VFDRTRRAVSRKWDLQLTLTQHSPQSECCVILGEQDERKKTRTKTSISLGKNAHAHQRLPAFSNIPPAAYYILPQETWGAKKCNRLARHTAKDGMGNKYHFKGYIGSWASMPATFGLTRYNGGCVHDGKWYEAEIRLSPKLAEDFGRS
jgi:hypothetical protein